MAAHGPSDRPGVAVVLPFHGSAAEAEEAVGRLAQLRTRPGDEVVIVDNTHGVLTRVPGGVRRILSPVRSSAYAARNVGAEATSAPWLLFVDADCRPVPDLLDRYFQPPPGAGEGALAGGLSGTPDQGGLIPAYVRSRRHLEEEPLLRNPYRPMAVTANLLVSRTAFEEVGGFHEHTRSGADADFCWRLQDAGWTLGHRPDAHVHHDHRADLRALLGQARRDGAAAPWLRRRHPGYRGTLGPRTFARSVAGALGWPLLGQPRRGLFKALDGIWAAAFDLGALDGNAPPRAPGPAPAAIVFVEDFPAARDPMPAALLACGRAVHVEAARRADPPDWRTGRASSVVFAEDEAPRDRLSALLRHRTTPVAARLRAAAPGAAVVATEGSAARMAAAVAASRREDLRVRVVGDSRAAADALCA